MNKYELALDKIRQERSLIIRDPKPTLGVAGIQANIAHLEARVQNAHDNWQSELNALQYWLDQLEQLEYSEIKG